MARIVESQRGQPLLVLEHFKYSKVTRPLASGEIKWRCINRKCTAFLKTFGINNDITEKNDDHLHEPISDQVLQRQYVTTSGVMLNGSQKYYKKITSDRVYTKIIFT